MSRFRFLSFVALAAALLVPTLSRGDDRQLLIEKKPAPPNVMLIISNTTTMANLPSTTTLDPLGGVDGTNSKMGQGKYAITKVVRNVAAGCAAGTGGCINWGISSFSYTRADLASGKKHFIFEPDADVALTYSGFTLTIPAHTKFNFGGASFPSNQTKTYNGNSYSVLAWSGTSLTNGTGTITDPSGTARTYFYPSAPQSATDAAHLPFGGSDGTKRILITGIPSSSNANGDPAAEMVVRITGTSPSGIMPYSIIRGSQSFTVAFTVGKCTEGGNPTAPCDPSELGSSQTYTANFVVPPEYCSETASTCAFPQLFGYGADVGREIGWASVPKIDNNQTVLDWSGNNSSGNASGWMQQSNNNPQPIVLIPHDYQPWLPYISGPGGKPSSAQQTYEQDPNPCILRALRPTASVVHVGSASATYTESDDFPMWDVTKSPQNRNSLPNSSACDLETDGYYQTGSHIIGNPDSSTNADNYVYQNSSNNRMIFPIFPTSNGNVAPLQGVMTNVFQYFNGANQPNVSGTGCATNSMVDNFCGAKRIDDPRKDCRNAAVILITDSYQAQSAVTQADVSPLAAINVPVYVVGFGINSGDLGPTNVCTIPDGNGGQRGGNRGECIALWSGATIVSSDKVTIVRQGYFSANNASDLIAALTSIANLLNEETRDFATATIPSVSATSEGLAYLSEFNPQNEHSIWSGHLRAFVLDPTSGLVQSTGGGFPLLTAYKFGTGSTAPSGSLVWDAGNTGQDARPTTSDIGVIGLLDKNTYVDPTQTLTAGAQWSNDNPHDQANATGKFGRDLFFGLKPQEGGCGSSTYECLVQIPSGTAGGSKSCAAPLTGCLNYPPTPASSLPAWWSIVRDNSDPASQTIYANIPNPLVYPNGTSPAGTEASAGAADSDAARNQALQNSFSFIRGNRDVVVEDLHISSTFGNPQTKTCAQLNGFASSPCYYDQILGDVFHSNPVIVSFPSNTRLFLSVDPGSANPGVYGDRSDSYQTFFANYRHRRKVMYAGADDGFLHAFDIGVYNGDQSTYTQGTITVCPLCNKYDLGSGREIFGYAPRATLRKFFYLAHATSHDWTLDGAPSVDDVYMDPARVGADPQGIVSSDACGSPCTNISGTSPKWRTVLIGTEREGGVNTTPNGGGGSVFALDITDPDVAEHMKKTWTGKSSDVDSGGAAQHPIIGSPECLVTHFDPSTDTTPTNCNAPYPRVLWEFRDDQATSTAADPVPAEGGAEASVWDLGYTWSKPVIGRIKVNDVASGNHHDMFVAIFGGGFRHNGTTIAGTNTAGDTANYLYMLDIETGKIVYKRNIGVWSTGASSTDTTGNLEAGVPGEAAVVDINFDGYLDRIYFGDTQGRLWKIDLTSPADLCSTSGSNCSVANHRIAESQWNPTLLFDEFQDAVPPSGTGVREPIFTRPAVFLLGTTGTGQPRLGIAFGTGDRDNMPALRDANPNYFFVVLDDPNATYPVYKTASGGSTASTLTQASLTTNNCDPTAVPNGCFNGTGVGYYLSLPVDTVYGGDQIAEIMNANPLVFSGSIFFNTFLNNTQVITNPDGTVTQVGQGVCGEVGQARLYQVNYLTGVSLYTDANGNLVPSKAPEGGQVASDPIVYQAPNGETMVVSATDDLKVPKVGGGGLANVNIKSWKEN